MKIQCVPTQVRNFEEIKFLSDTAREKLNQPGGVTIANAITRSGLVLLCGYFEGFLREMCKEFVDIINDSGVSAKLLPLSMLSDHSESCLIKLNNRSETKFSQFVNSLVSDLPLSMNSKKLSSTNANPTVDTIEKIFEVFGIEAVLDIITIEDYHFDGMYNNESQLTHAIRRTISAAANGDLAKEMAIISELERKWTPKLKRRRIGYIQVIDDLLKKRNRIAHGEGLEIITPDELEETQEAVLRLCLKLNSKLEDKLVNLIPSYTMHTAE
ncbi:TPA: MAE_28990/MAE_18760 family HEPN-like nuclease, partial [Serratia marcescens]